MNPNLQRVAPAVFHRTTSVPLPGTRFRMQLSPRELTRLQLARIFTAAHGEGQVPDGWRVKIATDHFESGHREVHEIHNVPVAWGDSLEAAVELVHRENERGLAVRVGLNLEPPDVDSPAAESFPSSTNTTSFLGVTIAWCPPGDVTEEHGALGQILAAPAIPNFGVQVSRSSPIHLVWLVDRPSTDFDKARSLYEGLRKYFGTAACPADFYEGTIPVAGTSLRPSKLRESSEAQLFQSGAVGSYSLRQLTDAFG